MASRYPQDGVNVPLQDQNLDTVDGFRKYLRKKFEQLSCIGTEFSKNRREKSSGEHSSEELLDSTDGNKNKKIPPSEFDWDDNKYDFSHPKRGLAIIINNEDFSKCRFLDNRQGSSKDASSLYNSFKLLGFDVDLYNNLEAWQMAEILEAATKYYDHGASDCFVCVVLTHGTDTVTNIEKQPPVEKVHVDLLYGTDGYALTVHYLTESFNDTYCPALENKPRIFFLQACRGKKCDDGQTILVEKTEQLNPLSQYERDDQVLKNKDLVVNLQEELTLSNDKPLQNLTLDTRDAVEESDANEDISNKPENSESNLNQLAEKRNALWNTSKDPFPCPAPLYDDFLIMYAAPPGHTAWRHSEDGSWFIQTLCKVLNDNDLASISLQRVLTRVSGEVARDFESKNEEYPDKKGMPVIQSKLLKDIFIPKKGQGNSC